MLEHSTRVMREQHQPVEMLSGLVLLAEELRGRMVEHISDLIEQNRG